MRPVVGRIPRHRLEALVYSTFGPITASDLTLRAPLPHIPKGNHLGVNEARFAPHPSEPESGVAGFAALTIQADLAELPPSGASTAESGVTDRGTDATRAAEYVDVAGWQTHRAQPTKQTRDIRRRCLTTHAHQRPRCQDD
jgi:hypothetical protein